jgi:hypothetical protein
MRRVTSFPSVIPARHSVIPAQAGIQSRPCWACCPVLILGRRQRRQGNEVLLVGGLTDEDDG